MKTLVIVTHPNINESVINKRWVQELEKHPDRYVIHQLYRTYPDGEIDVTAEQKLIEQYDKLVFQFPLYWFSSPPLLKKWFDEVLVHGWAFGSKSGYKLSGKKVTLAITAGIDEHEFSAHEKYKYTLTELTRPFELTFDYVRADYRPFFAYYGLEYNGTESWVEKSVPKYIDFLDSWSLEERLLSL